MSGVLIGRQTFAGELNSGERMLAGGGSIAGGRTPAKPLWSEVIVFFGVFLRQKDRCPEVVVSSDEQGLIGRQTCAGELNSGERMLAGGGCVAGGCIPAKPSW